MTLLIATGLRREARLMAGPGVVVIAGGGDAKRLEQTLEEAAMSASAILSSGLAGALDPGLKAGDVVIGTGCSSLAEREVARSDSPSSREQNSRASDLDREFYTKLGEAAPTAHRGLIAAGDFPIATADQKARLYAATGALSIDMESHIAARVAARQGLPFAALRVISDPANITLPPAALVGMSADGGIALLAILRSLARNPTQLPALIRLGRDANRAFRVLGGLHDMLRRGGIGGLDAGEFALDMG